MAYFPMMVSLENRPVLVVGGGAEGLKKVRVLHDFGARITLVAKDALPEAKAVRRVKRGNSLRIQVARLKRVDVVVFAGNFVPLGVVMGRYADARVERAHGKAEIVAVESLRYRRRAAPHKHVVQRGDCGGRIVQERAVPVPEYELGRHRLFCGLRRLVGSWRLGLLRVGVRAFAYRH